MCIEYVYHYYPCSGCLFLSWLPTMLRCLGSLVPTATQAEPSLGKALCPVTASPTAVFWWWPSWGPRKPRLPVGLGQKWWRASFLAWYYILSSAWIQLHLKQLGHWVWQGSLLKYALKLSPVFRLCKKSYLVLPSNGKISLNCSFFSAGGTPLHIKQEGDRPII